MVDFRERHEFQKPNNEEVLFLNLLKNLRQEIHEEAIRLFSESDIKLRFDAFTSLMNIEKRYFSLAKSLTREHQRQLKKALESIPRKVERALEQKAVSFFMIIDDITIKFINPQTQKEYTLFDYFQKRMLKDELIEFRTHLSFFDPEFLSEYFPGLDHPDLMTEIQQKKGHQHIVFNNDGIDYDIILDEDSGCNLAGKGILRDFDQHVHQTIPQGSFPAGITSSLEEIIRRIE